MGIWRDFGRDLISAFKRSPVESRSIDTVPWGSGGSNPRNRSSGNALSLIPYFASVRILAEQVSALPLQTFRQDGDISKRITDPQLIKNPSVIVDPVTWKRQAMISLATNGNAVGIITGFDGLGFATGIEWIPWNELYVDETNPLLPRYWWAPAVARPYQEIPRERIVHVAWFVKPGKVVGLSPIAAFADSIGVGLSAQQYGANWFSNGGVPPATFKNIAKTVSAEQAEEITDRLVSSLRSGRPLTYGSDWEFNSVAINPEESQFIETMRMNATHIAAIFGIPPEWVGGETGGSYTYSSPEQGGAYLHRVVLLPWLTLLETILSRLLPEKQFVQFNPDAIVRSDLKTRYDAYQVGIDAGFLTINEVRELENRPPLPKPKPVPIPVSDPANSPTPDPNAPPKTNGNGTGRKLIPLQIPR